MSPSDQQPRRRITRHYARAFLFSVRAGSPLARLHVITKAMLVLGVSALVVRFMRTGDPDPVGAGLLMLVSFGLLLLSGAGRWLFRSYLGAIFPMLCLLTLVWIVFNPNPGSVTYFSLPLHDGVIDLRLTPWLPLFAVSAALAGRLARRRPPWLGLLLGFAVAHAAAWLPGWPAHTIARLALFQPVSLLVSDANLLLALTKAMGYAALVFVSLLFMMTTRDTEFLGAMRQFRLPYSAAFFFSLGLRNLSSAALDFEAIRQAQVARGGALHRPSLWGRLRDLAGVSLPLTAALIRRTTEVSDAVAARGYRLGMPAPVDFHEIQPLRAADIAVLALLALLLLGALGFSIHFTRVLGLA